MKFSRTVLSAAFAVASLASVSAYADNSLTFQGVTFTTSSVDADTLHLSITGALGATGDWLGITQMSAFEIKGFGVEATSATGGGVVWTLSDNALSAGGCVNGNTDGGCFSASSNVALTNSMGFDIDFAGPLGSGVPHLKVLFLDADGTKTGSLLSQDLPGGVVPGVPEPETYALMLAGLGVVGFMARRRKQQA